MSRIKRGDTKRQRRVWKINRIVSEYSQLRYHRERPYSEISSENLMREQWIKETKHEILSLEQSLTRNREKLNKATIWRHKNKEISTRANPRWFIQVTATGPWEADQ